MAKGSSRLNKILGSTEAENDDGKDQENDKLDSTIIKNGSATVSASGKSDHEESNIKSRSDKREIESVLYWIKTMMMMMMILLHLD